MVFTPCKCGHPNDRQQHICATPAPKVGNLTEVKESPIVPCECGFWTNRIQHVCAEKNLRVVEPCHCGFRDRSFQHVCAVKPLAQVLKEKREALLNPPPRPDNMCANCPSDSVPCKACWARAGYPEREYYRTFPQMRPRRERVLRVDWKKVPVVPPAPESESERETEPELPDPESSERYLVPSDLGEE